VSLQIIQAVHAHLTGGKLVFQEQTLIKKQQSLIHPEDTVIINKVR
jgi:hypothetical protein